MTDYTLNADEIKELRAAHRQARNSRDAYRINAVILLAQGWTAADIATALLMDSDTVRNHFKRYRQGGLRHLLQVNYVGSEPYLSAEQLDELDCHLQCHVYSTAKEIAHWVKEQWQVCYTPSGMAAVLRRLGYVYKQTRLVPDTVKPEIQEQFVENYKKLNKNKDEVVLFMDAVHPQHQPISARGWIKRGQEMQIKTNNSQKRVNINGAIDIDSLTTVVRFEDKINSDSVIKLLDQIENTFPDAQRITIICDNATYYRAKAVQEHIQNSRIELLFIPSRSPNLNLIERLWKFFKRQVLYNKYYSCFGTYEDACRDFFRNLDRYAVPLRSLLTENFEIVRHY